MTEQYHSDDIHDIESNNIPPTPAQVNALRELFQSLKDIAVRHTLTAEDVYMLIMQTNEMYQTQFTFPEESSEYMTRGNKIFNPEDHSNSLDYETNLTESLEEYKPFLHDMVILSTKEGQTGGIQTPNFNYRQTEELILDESDEY